MHIITCVSRAIDGVKCVTLWANRHKTIEKMKISIIGAGNMGGAIARGLAGSEGYGVTVSNHTSPKLEALKQELGSAIETTTDNVEAAAKGDIIILAVKPWVAESVVAEIRSTLGGSGKKKLLVSIAAGITTAKLAEWTAAWVDGVELYYAIPNTAIRLRKSMTFVSAGGSATPEGLEAVRGVFGHLGKVMMVDERQIPACMALASCGIAYALRYVRANMEGAIELGLRAADAQQIVAQTMEGAAALIAGNGSHPEVEIDKVCTPGGLTIKGINALERGGFSSAVVEALKASV